MAYRFMSALPFFLAKFLAKYDAALGITDLIDR